MNLHRIEGQAEWGAIPATQQNLWQRLAQRTHAVITPGNILTIVGLLLGIAGLVGVMHQQYWFGFAALIAGRLCDLLDGIAADKTGTKSPLGEALDATADKVITVLTLLVLLVEALAPGILLVALFIPHAVTAVISLSSLKKSRRLHPSYAGKSSMALAWVSLIGIILRAALGAGEYSAFAWVVYSLALASISLGCVAVIGYRRA